MNQLVHVLCGILLRLWFFYSKLKPVLNRIFLFDMLPYSMSNLKEIVYSNTFSPKTNPSHNFMSPMTKSIFSFCLEQKNELISILKFIIMDVLIGLILSKMKQNYTSKNYLLIIYMYNPISIFNCSALRLDIFYTLTNLLWVFNYDKNTLISTCCFVLSTFTAPGYFFVNLFMLIWILCTNKKRFLHYLIGLTVFIIISYFYTNGNIFKDTMEIYYNYYTIKDTQPNFSMIWSLLSEIFLKYQLYYMQMLFVYQIIIMIGVMCLIARINYHDSFQLLYGLIFMVNHIIDRYPCENHYLILLLLVLPHWQIIKTKTLSLAVYCSFAGVTLIYSRGYGYRLRRVGSSNYLYFQNLFYDAFLVFVFLSAVTSINLYRKEEKNKNKIQQVIDEIIDKIDN